MIHAAKIFWKIISGKPSWESGELSMANSE